MGATIYDRFPVIIAILKWMALQKVSPTALRRFFRTSTYYMDAFAPEKPPSLFA
jgi:hypothetical protein